MSVGQKIKPPSTYANKPQQKLNYTSYNWKHEIASTGLKAAINANTGEEQGIGQMLLTGGGAAGMMLLAGSTGGVALGAAALTIGIGVISNFINRDKVKAREEEARRQLRAQGKEFDAQAEKMLLAAERADDAQMKTQREANKVARDFVNKANAITYKQSVKSVKSDFIQVEVNNPVLQQQLFQDFSDIVDNANQDFQDLVKAELTYKEESAKFRESAREARARAASI